MSNYDKIEQIVVAVKLGTPKNETTLVQVTAGVLEEDRDYILNMAERVELFEGRYEPKNLFSCLLPSGLSVIGRLTLQTSPENEPVPDSFYLECLLVDYPTYYRCGGNPIALVSEAISSREFALYRPGRVLRSFSLTKRQELIKEKDLAIVTKKMGERALTILLESIFSGRTFFVTADSSAYLLLSCVFSLIPFYSRRALTFSVDIRFRGDSTIRLIGVTRKREERVLQDVLENDGEFLDLRDVVNNSKEYYLMNAWCLFIELGVFRFDAFFDFFYYALVTNMEQCEEGVAIGEEPFLSFKDVKQVGVAWIREWVSSSGRDEESVEPEFEDGEAWKKCGDVEWKGLPEENEYTTDEAGKEVGRTFGDFLNSYLEEFEERKLEPATENELQEMNPQVNDGSLGKGHSGKNDLELEGVDSTLELEESCDLIRDKLNSLGLDSPEDVVVNYKGDSVPAFDILLSEFPCYNTELRRLNGWIEDVCAGKGLDAVDILEGEWGRLSKTLSQEALERIRDVYVDQLYNASKRPNTGDPERSAEVLIGRIETLRILSKEARR